MEPERWEQIERLYHAALEDGQRFLVSLVTERAAAPPINVVLNWTADAPK